jgi:nickel/cobalt transporter (NiCoT) family protein
MALSGQQPAPGARATMRAHAQRVAHSLTPREWRRMGRFAAAVAALHTLGFGLLALALARHVGAARAGVFGAGLGITAYTLGLRHAFDADHVAAIDNATRKLMAEGKRPLGVGFFFSLGHSTIVFALALALGTGARALGPQATDAGSALHELGGVLGTSISGAFLYALAAINVVVLTGIVRALARARSAHTADPDAGGSELELACAGGLMARVLAPVSRRVQSSWQMYPVGVLFGLGFDTATEVALLLLAAGTTSSGLPFYAIVCLPVLFAAGMSLLDTIDGSFMNFAYGWAFSRPARKLFYNLAITGLSAAVALLIGTVELMSVVAEELHLRGAFWGWISGLDLNTMGYAIAGLFVLTWALALAVWRLARLDERWQVPARSP